MGSAKNKNIPGIYSYCDRWCERCTFTSRCKVYEGESTLTPEEKDINNEAFWKNISKNFEEAGRLLQQAAKKFGVDLSALPEPTVAEIEQEEAVEAATRSHPLSQISLTYAADVRQWLDGTAFWKTQHAELIQQLELGIQSPETVQQTSLEIIDCREVINWYSHFIHVKIIRAIRGKIEDDGWELENGFQRDFDGTAKIARVAIERSLHAWVRLSALIPSQEDIQLNALAKLQKLKSLVEAEFPEAHRFIRPGFDEGMRD
jgi:hypothetical protein